MTKKPTKLGTGKPTNLEQVMGEHHGGEARASRAAVGGVKKTAGKRLVHDVLGLRIDREGTWYYHDSPILRKELVCLFASVLTQDESGRYWMVTPAEMGEVEVADAPFIAVEVMVRGQGTDQVLTIRTNIDEIVTVDQTCPLFVEFDAKTGEPSPYVRTSRGLTARLSRPVYYELVGIGVEREEEGRTELGVWSNGAFFSLGACNET